MTTQSKQPRDTYREDVAGRANVADTPELLAYYDQLDRLEAGALWTVANKIEPWQPQSQSVPVVWRYADLRDHVLRSLELVMPEKAGRRVIFLSNPGRRDVSAAVGWLYTGLQVMNPGEVASAHAHSTSALRFIMEGAGAYTIVDGHKMTLGANDFVLTPNGTWHEHGVEATGVVCIWQDGLDIPLVNALEANFFAMHPDVQQTVGHPVDDMRDTWGSPGLTPSTGTWSKAYSPLLKYEWSPTYEAPSCRPLALRCRCCAGASAPRRTAAPAASSTSAAREAGTRSSAASASNGASATSSACPPGCGTSMPTCPRQRTPASSRSTTCRSCARSASTPRKRSATTAAISPWRPDAKRMTLARAAAAALKRPHPACDLIHSKWRGSHSVRAANLF
jgi:hypothetical protein